jgi:hypothetical protein
MNHSSIVGLVTALALAVFPAEAQNVDAMVK